MSKNDTADSQKKTTAAQKARETEPQSQTQPLRDISSGSQQAGRKWSSYMRDENGTEYFYDKDAIIQPSKGLLRMWRKREFPAGAAQKEL